MGIAHVLHRSERSAGQEPEGDRGVLNEGRTDNVGVDWEQMGLVGA